MYTDAGARRRIGGEALVIAGVAILAVSLIWPLAHYVRNRRMIRETRRAVRTLLNACARYRLEYGRWPGADRRPGSDIRFGMSGSPNRRLMAMLWGRAGMRQGRDPAANPRDIVFWEPSAWQPGKVGVNEFGELLDPWGMPFQVVVDGDMNGVCDVPRSVYGQIEAGLLVWSFGPDRRSDTSDDIRSW